MENNSENKHFDEESSTTKDEGSFKDQEETRSQKAKASFMNRPIVVPGSRSTKATLSLMLGTLILISFIWFWDNHKSKESEVDSEQEYTTNYKPGNFSVSTAPLNSTQVTPETPQRDEKAEALQEARFKSAMVIYQKDPTPSVQNGHGTHFSDPNAQFQAQLSGREVEVSRVQNLGPLHQKILQGKILSATLETAVNSDLPGMVRAILSYDVYAETGRRVLLPQGTRLIGEYNSAIRKGQARVFMVWSRAILPNGTQIMLHSAGTDPLGRSGIRGKVNNHFWQIFGTSTLLSILGAASATVGVDTGDEFNSLAAYREEVANSFQESSAQVLDRYIDIPPTIELKAGTPIKILVARDLDFSARSAPMATQMRPWVIRP